VEISELSNVELEWDRSNDDDGRTRGKAWTAGGVPC
jgi:hypothetical protein